MIISTQIIKVIPIPPKPSKMFQARFTNIKAYDYIWDTIRNLQREKEDELGACTIGNALLFICKNFNNGRGVKIDNKDKPIPYYYKLNKIREMNDWAIRAGEGYDAPLKWLKKELSTIMVSENDEADIKALALIKDKKERLIFINGYLNKLYIRIEKFLKAQENVKK